ncbi:protein kinase STUNTED-like [Andrographis paniculata]|uniref:protein kinase STUNTED-like n=1 Tax=Andrographis paniculata TaxID=175694 RepID=UPI0021E799E8|nr:protein kinase STUNTED-like [Andrographis paniculata]
MAIDRLPIGAKTIVVGIKLDAEAKELLDWALVKVADPGDCVLAIHACFNSECIPRQKTLLDGYLVDYEGLCNSKKVALNGEVLKGNSTRKVLLNLAKNISASSLIVGVNKYTSFMHRVSTAKYCAKRLPPATEVMAIYNGKVVFSRCSKFLFEGPCLDPKPSFYTKDIVLKDILSEFGESEVSEDISSKEDIIVVSPINGRRKASLSSISLPAEDFTKQRPGWPLLQTSSLVTQPALDARNMSVVQWVMALPQRHLLDVSVATSYDTDDSVEREYVKLAEASAITDMLANRRELPEDLKAILIRNSADCEIFSYGFLRAVTSNFSSDNLIGKGGCNSVYKGLLPQGKAIAVKTLDPSKGSWKDFIREIDIATALKHRSIAPLLGICVEENDLISVYDFMPKGNLAENLHGNRKGTSGLPWQARFRIAVGVADALTYLHDECPRPVIHKDVKSSNILLTDELEPQLCDFGLAVWGPTREGESFVMDKDVVGTFGYLAPEYFMYGKVSEKIDVYAFGVVVLELLSGRKPVGIVETTKGQESFLIWAKGKLESRDYKSILDPKVDGKVDEVQLQRMGAAAALCLTQAARLRPKMCQVVNVLHGLERERETDRDRDGDGDDAFYDDEEEEDDEVYPESSIESHLINLVVG